MAQKPQVHYQIRHGLLLSSITGLANSGGEIMPSVGIYYVVNTHEKWMVMACRYVDVEEEIDHVKFWEDYVCRRLAGHWATKVAHPFSRLSKLLKEHPYGFPRGRVVCHGAKYEVYHGSDIPKASGVTRGLIEIIFGIKDKAKWVEDDHEHCLHEDKEAVRALLGHSSKNSISLITSLLWRTP